MNEDNLYEKISKRRKKEQEEGRMPKWYTSAGAQLFYEKYLYDAEDVRGQFERIASTAASHLPDQFKDAGEQKFFDLLWNGWLSPSTPVLSNMGTNRGLPVSCSGGFIQDSVSGFYETRLETAVLTKNGFGTSADLSSIRPRGSNISVGGKASGVVPVFKGYVQDMRDISQGTARRGAWAGYLDIEHADFDELIDHINSEPDDANVGWVIRNSFIDKLNGGDREALRRFQKALKMKLVLGKGYFFFIDKANDKRPQMYKDHGLDIKASNLCSEIMLHSSPEYTYTCVLSSMNVAKFDEWESTDAVFWATVFLDCVAEEFIKKAEKIKHLEKAVNFTKKGRALGLGQCGFHTYLQSKMIAFESFQAHMINNQISRHIHEKSLEASKWMAEHFGEPEWCKGYGVRNTHRIAIAPTKSTALLMGGVSEGINPDPAMSYTQMTAGGEMTRLNPFLMDIMKQRGVYDKKTIREINEAFGSVQNVSWLDENEKLVFKTAFEINQETIIRLASARSKYIDQWQSVNLFFSQEEDEEWIAKVHQQAFEDPNILALYYIYSMSGVQASKECLACQ